MRFTLLFAGVATLLALCSPTADAAGYLGGTVGAMIPTIEGFGTLASLGPTGGWFLNEYLSLEVAVTISLFQGEAPNGKEWGLATGGVYLAYRTRGKGYFKMRLGCCPRPSTERTSSR